jgi:hypothetical protein
MNETHTKQGDLVIGNADPNKAVFSSSGGKLTAGVYSVGAEETLDEMKAQFLKNASMAGAKIETTKNKTKAAKTIKTTKSSKLQTSPRTDTSENVRNWLEREEKVKFLEPEQPKEIVTFENSFGRIRVTVEAVQEHQMAFMLIFSEVSQLIFEPKIGESLSFSRHGKDYQVYYPGVIFDWPDRVKKAMILFKQEEEA